MSDKIADKIAEPSLSISENEVYEVKKNEKNEVSSRVKVSAKSLGKNSVKAHHNSELLFERQHPLVKKFLFETEDYFDIAASSGTAKTPYGDVKYLAKVVLGSSGCVLVRDDSGEYSSEQGRAAAAHLLLNDWNKARFIVFGKDKLPMYESPAPCIWSMFEMPSLRRRFYLLCYMKFISEKLGEASEIGPEDLSKLNLTDMILEFLGKGNKVNRGINELEEIRYSLIRTERCFTDKALASVIALYLAECISFRGKWNAVYENDSLVIKYTLNYGTLCFDAGKFALDLFKNPYSKCTLIGCVRSVITALSEPGASAPADYSPYIHWSDGIFDNLKPEWHYENLDTKGLPEDRPVFIDAHAEANAKRCEALKKSDIKEFASGASMNLSWWCSQCQCFTHAERAVPVSRSLDFARVSSFLSSVISESESEFCTKCRRPILPANLKYASIHMYYDWPGADICVEAARLRDGRLVKGWGYINVDKLIKAEEASAEKTAVSLKKSDSSASESSAVQTDSSYKDIFREFSYSGDWNELFFKTFGRYSSPMRFACDCLKEAYNLIAEGKDFSRELRPAGGTAYLEITDSPDRPELGCSFEEDDGTDYFVIFADMKNFEKEIECCRIQGAPRLTAKFWLDWSVFLELAEAEIEKKFKAEKIEASIKVGGENSRSFRIETEKVWLDIDAAEQLMLGLYENLYPESVISKLSDLCAEKFKQAEEVWNLSESYNKTGLVSVRFIPDKHSYSVKFPDQDEFLYDCSELNNAPEGALQRAKFIFTPNSPSIFKCRCGENASVSLKFIKRLDPDKNNYVSFTGSLPNIFINPRSIVETEMAKRYNIFCEEREKVRQDSGEEAAAMFEFSSRNHKKIFTDPNAPAYDKAFNSWYHFMDDLKIFNASRAKTGMYPVYALRCFNHCQSILKKDIEAVQLTASDLNTYMMRSLDRVGGNFEACIIDNILAVRGCEASFIALDARLAVGICRTCGFALPSFFKVHVPDFNAVMFGTAETSEEAFENVKNLAFKRWNIPADKLKPCLFERECFCSMAKGRFNVKLIN